MSDNSRPTLSFDRWFPNVVDVVSALANESAQEGAWGQASLDSTFNSPDELMCVFFDDAIVPDFLEEHGELLGDRGVSYGKQLTSILENYRWPMTDGFIDAARLLKDERWREVRLAARRFLDALNTVKETTK